jgi:predicted component of type VI protein secretion system
LKIDLFFVENIEYLLEFNVDMSIKTLQQLDALTIACMKKEQTLVELMLNKMDDFEPKNYSNLLTLAIKKSKVVFFIF